MRRDLSLLLSVTLLVAFTCGFIVQGIEKSFTGQRTNAFADWEEDFPYYVISYVIRTTWHSDDIARAMNRPYFEAWETTLMPAIFLEKGDTVQIGLYDTTKGIDSMNLVISTRGLMRDFVVGRDWNEGRNDGSVK